jgi:hypothetical protein
VPFYRSELGLTDDTRVSRLQCRMQLSKRGARSQHHALGRTTRRVTGEHRRPRGELVAKTAAQHGAALVHHAHRLLLDLKVLARRGQVGLERRQARHEITVAP